MEQAKAIEDKRMEIELEAASDSANKFLEQSSPLEARQDHQESLENPIPRIESGVGASQDPPAVETADTTGSQPNPHDSSQDQA